MKCPFCNAEDNHVVDSRSVDNGHSIRRRRECNICNKRFTTYETIEMIPLVVIKNDGKRVIFDRSKLRNGIIRSCYKRDIPVEKIFKLADNVEKELYNQMCSEIPSKKIGELVMNHLKEFDEVAYIRFASVYRKFSDSQNFAQEIEKLRLDKKK